MYPEIHETFRNFLRKQSKYRVSHSTYRLTENFLIYFLRNFKFADISGIIAEFFHFSFHRFNRPLSGEVTSSGCAAS